MFKIENNQAPSYLQDLVPEPIQACTRYNLRNRHDLQIPFARHETYSQSFFPAAARLWNSLSLNIRQATTDFTFKNRFLKEFPRPNFNNNNNNNAFIRRLFQYCSKAPVLEFPQKSQLFE
jgi:hypothetical protein